MSNTQREYVTNILSSATAFLLGAIVTDDAWLRSEQTGTNVWAIYGGITIFAGLICLGQCLLAVWDWKRAAV